MDYIVNPDGNVRAGDFDIVDLTALVDDVGASFVRIALMEGNDTSVGTVVALMGTGTDEEFLDNQIATEAVADLTSGTYFAFAGPVLFMLPGRTYEFSTPAP
jgi:hypothetical protein